MGDKEIEAIQERQEYRWGKLSHQKDAEDIDNLLKTREAVIAKIEGEIDRWVSITRPDPKSFIGGYIQGLNTVLNFIRNPKEV